jgi:hypothetical protein
MAVTSTKYTEFVDSLLGGDTAGEAPIDWLSDTIKFLLVTSSYTFSAAHDFLDDMTNELASGNGYTTGGETLASKTLQAGVADAADILWSFSASKTFAGGILYKDTGSAATSPLILYVDYGGSITTAIPFNHIWHASGIITLT